MSRGQKADPVIELRAMDNPGEPAQDAFEVREGIEMVPGTVHLVDSESHSKQDKEDALGSTMPGDSAPLHVLC